MSLYDLRKYAQYIQKIEQKYFCFFHRSSTLTAAKVLVAMILAAWLADLSQL